jgi:hypothetical protein
MERLLDLLYNDMAMSTMAVQFGLTGVVAAAAGVLWYTIIRATGAGPSSARIPVRRR